MGVCSLNNNSDGTVTIESGGALDMFYGAANYGAIDVQSGGQIYTYYSTLSNYGTLDVENGGTVSDDGTCTLDCYPGSTLTGTASFAYLIVESGAVVPDEGSLGYDGVTDNGTVCFDNYMYMCFSAPINGSGNLEVDGPGMLCSRATTATAT